ncbi:hypothetical protein [Methylotenera mobilis]|uniref:Uncharacterized protein n=1 Tax=Methylotenera mobilis (strain JLW8 / ATCC BAA-1282 / DSM 17540) TaxID=583345 RepID=C6WY06_METML|nr:hypothetical protein [Methylotenera mobilis]ACT48805.1 conserved hypothetical protein [Methylotenera mobilis JLW8]
MKVLRSLLVVLALGAATLSSAQARDSVSFALNIGGPGYYAYPAAVQYVAPPVAYYPGYSVYYDTAPYAYQYYYPATVYRGGYGFYGNYYSGRHHHHGDGRHGGYRR